ncbi:hypothetical protein ISN44_As13g015950 [Arabidopsis suecica]|uniref:Uncharacterized protein n=1 Tax=Arabidopsis suecica TaxID=45249 RepID=A0A8T1XT10_ARASU|nr:hypothetical protein ISN44_As13g015950 [Arabidopsis suecica]
MEEKKNRNEEYDTRRVEKNRPKDGGKSFPTIIFRDELGARKWPFIFAMLRLIGIKIKGDEVEKKREEKKVEKKREERKVEKEEEKNEEEKKKMEENEVENEEEKNEEEKKKMEEEEKRNEDEEYDTWFKEEEKKMEEEKKNKDDVVLAAMVLGWLKLLG